MWAKNYDKCVKCGSTEYPHHGHGLCYVCYQREVCGVKSEYKPRLSWSRYYDSCVQCHQTVFPHVAKGLCSRCYREKRKEGVVSKENGMFKVRE